MLGLISSLTKTDEISLTGFSREYSQYDKTSEVFTELAFEVSGFPSHELTQQINKYFVDYFSENNHSELVYEHGCIILLNQKAKPDELQGLVNQLKLVLDSANEYIKNKLDKDAQKENKFNDAINSLKF